jgi:hypothetical protein
VSLREKMLVVLPIILFYQLSLAIVKVVNTLDSITNLKQVSPKPQNLGREERRSSLKKVFI